MIDGYKIGSWEDRQRVAYCNGSLAQDRIKHLEETVDGWEWYVLKQLSDVEKQEIRRAYAEKKANQTELAQQYGVSQATIWNVLQEGA